MIFLLAFCFVIIIPLALFYFKYGKHNTYQTFFSKGGFFWMILLLLWGTKKPSLLISEIDFVVLTFLFMSLSFLASLCLEDIMHLSVPSKSLFLAIFFLIGLHFFRLWQEYNIILNDYIISASCALCIWIISKLFLIITGRSSLGGADTPLIFALSL